MKRIFAALALAAALALVFAAGGCKRPGPEEILASYYRLLEARDYEAAYGLLSEPAREKITQEEFCKKLSSIYSEVGITQFLPDMLVFNQSKALTSAQYSLKMPSPGGELTGEFTMNMEREASHWKIDWAPALIFPNMTWGDTVRVNRLTAKRGEIFAGDTLIATNAPGVTVLGNPEKIEDLGAFSRQVGALIEEPPDKIRNLLERAGDKLARLKTYSTQYLPAELEQALLAIDGVGIDSGNYYSYRQYPRSEYYLHVAGYSGKITEQELENLSPEDEPFYNADSIIGKSGLEFAYERRLRGVDGREIYIVDEKGAKKGMLYTQPAQNGEDIVLTINDKLQSRALDLLSLVLNQNGTGAVVILDPTTGAVEALASYPSIDPNRFISGISEQDWQEINSAASGKPLFNKALQGLYPPGSVIKPLTASFALECGAINADSSFPFKIEDDLWTPEYSNWFYPGIKRVENKSGKCDLKNGMIWSDNIFFAWAAIQTGEEKFIELCERAGFGESIPFDLPVARSRVMNKDTQFNIKLLADSGYGQGELLVTPLQMAAMFGALAADGDIMRPYVVEGTYRADGADYLVTEQTKPQVYKQGALDRGTLDTVLPLLRGVAREGTAKSLKAKFELAAKTGTAEIGNDKSREISWIAAFKYTQPRDKLILVMCDIAEGQSQLKLRITNGLLEVME